MKRRVGPYERFVRPIKKFATSRVSILEDELAALDTSARKSAVRYLHKAVKELRLLEKELVRIEMAIAPAPPRSKRRVRKGKAAPAAAVVAAA
jgi:hypothetical protein